MDRTRTGPFGPLSLIAIVLTAWLASPSGTLAQQDIAQQDDRLAEPFYGISTDGDLDPGLFPVRSTGVSTAPIVQAAKAYLNTLTAGQKARTMFDLDDEEWHKIISGHHHCSHGFLAYRCPQCRPESDAGNGRASSFIDRELIVISISITV